jgi:predicted DNA-binding transcriptional regulator AlpA
MNAKSLQGAGNAVEHELFLTVRDLAGVLKCSSRHVTNLRNRGQIPRPIKLGAKVLWHKRQFLDWIEAGCSAISV